MHKGEISVACILIGVLLGMIISAICMSYSLHVDDIELAIATSCNAPNKAILVDGYFFGNTLKIKCTDGKISRQQLVLHGNRINVDDHGK